jgi:hypothetical protein
MSNTDQARKQGQQDAQKGRGPADTKKMPTPVREAYEAGYKQGKK